MISSGPLMWMSLINQSDQYNQKQTSWEWPEGLTYLVAKPDQNLNVCTESPHLILDDPGGFECFRERKPPVYFVLILLKSSFLHDLLPLICSKSKHPNIVRLLGKITLKDGKWIIPLEFVFGEDLETTIFKASKSKISVRLLEKRQKKWKLKLRKLFAWFAGHHCPLTHSIALL